MRNEMGVMTTDVTPFRFTDDRKSYFLDTPSQQMVDWYYRRSETDTISVEQIDDRLMSVQIAQLVGDSIKVTSITIGPSQKRQICKSYMFYHPFDYNI